MLTCEVPELNCHFVTDRASMRIQIRACMFNFHCHLIHARPLTDGDGLDPGVDSVAPTVRSSYLLYGPQST